MLLAEAGAGLLAVGGTGPSCPWDALAVPGLGVRGALAAVSPGTCVARACESTRGRVGELGTGVRMFGWGGVTLSAVRRRRRATLLEWCGCVHGVAFVRHQGGVWIPSPREVCRAQPPHATAEMRSTPPERGSGGVEKDEGYCVRPARSYEALSARRSTYLVTVTPVMTTSSSGRSRGSVATAEIASTTALEASSATAPKIVCLPWSHSVGAVVMKNCEPLVP